MCIVPERPGLRLPPDGRCLSASSASCARLGSAWSGRKATLHNAGRWSLGIFASKGLVYSRLTPRIWSVNVRTGRLGGFARLPNRRDSELFPDMGFLSRKWLADILLIAGSEG
jgi:hypothetical protein